MTTRKTADDIATLFATHRDGSIMSERGWWLSQKQTSWLVSQALCEDAYHEHCATGKLSNGAYWTCRVSPVNQCGWFSIGKDAVTTVSEFEAKRTAKRAELEATIARWQALLPGGAEYATLTPEQVAALEPMLDLMQEQLTHAQEALAQLG